MNTASQLPAPLVESIAGFTAGVATTFFAHPLDLLKTRLQGEFNLGAVKSQPGVLTVNS